MIAEAETGPPFGTRALPCSSHSRPSRTWIAPKEATSVWVLPRKGRKKDRCPRPAKSDRGQGNQLPGGGPRYPISNGNGGARHHTDSARSRRLAAQQAARLGPPRGSSMALATLRIVTCPSRTSEGSRLPIEQEPRQDCRHGHSRSDAQPAECIAQLMHPG